MRIRIVRRRREIVGQTGNLPVKPSMHEFTTVRVLRNHAGLRSVLYSTVRHVARRGIEIGRLHSLPRIMRPYQTPAENAPRGALMRDLREFSDVAGLTTLNQLVQCLCQNLGRPDQPMARAAWIGIDFFDEAAQGH